MAGWRTWRTRLLPVEVSKRAGVLVMWRVAGVRGEKDGVGVKGGGAETAIRRCLRQAVGALEERDGEGGPKGSGCG
jgi:hypothetical protein